MGISLSSLDIGGIFSGAGKLVKSIRSAITGKEVLSSEDRGKIEGYLATLEEKLLGLQSEVVAAQKSIIVAEAQGDSWLQRNWRPMIMSMFGFIIFNNYVLYPYMDAIFGWGVKLDTPPELWSLIKIGLGGYVIGRSAEKATKYYRSNN